VGEWGVRDGFDFLHVEYSKIGPPLMELEQRIVIRTEILRNRLPSNRLPEHPAKRHSIDDSGMQAKPNDPARVLVHHDQYPVRSQGCGLAAEQIDAPKAVLHMAQKGKPGWTAGFGRRPEMKSQNASHYVLVDHDTEGQGDLLRNSGTSPGGIALFHLDDGINNVPSGPFWARFPWGSWRKKEAVFPILQRLVEAQQRGGLKDDCGTDQTGGAYQQRAEPSDDAVGYP
jgi:hypothetical protein